MGILVYPLLCLMQDLYHQQYCHGGEGSGSEDCLFQSGLLFGLHIFVKAKDGSCLDLRSMREGLQIRGLTNCMVYLSFNIYNSPRV